MTGQPADPHEGELSDWAYADLDAESRPAAPASEPVSVEERVAAALYERAMEERVTCLRNFKHPGGWWREPYVPPFAEGQSRPTNWRDGWREDARAALASARGGRDGWPETCGNCGAGPEHIGYDHADGFTCSNCGACDSDG